MLRLIHRSNRQSLVAALVIACLFSLAAPVAAASPSDSDKAAVSEVASPAEPNATAKGEPTTTAPGRALGVSYAAYNGAVALPAEASLEAATRPRSVVGLVAAVNAATARPIPLPAPSQSPGVISTAPMTAGEKFEAWFRSHFLSPGAYGKAVYNGMSKELQDNDDLKKDTTSNFFADSMTRAARSFTSSATNAFYEKALFASLFRQDPRYHRSGKKAAGAKIVYAATRVLITQGDRCGCHQFNASFLLGGAAGALTANLWERRERTGNMHTVRRYYNHVAMTALFNIVKEFVGGQ
ncbi:MAG: hypothetical protein AABO41_11575 [Acidobacteriota bacterium]